MRPHPALAPLTLPYGVGVAIKNLAYARGWVRPAALGWPVVSVGGLSVGGSGKTPAVVALASLLQAHGMAVDVLTRGYGRRPSLPAERVQPGGSAARFGDEPLLIARAAGVPVYVGASRLQAGRLAEAEAPGTTGLHLLDDGFQHRKLSRTVDLVVLHPEDMAQRLLPAGRLREWTAALGRADFLLLRADDSTTAPALREAGIHKPLWRLRRTLAISNARARGFAFCGIARPEEFFSALRLQGVQLTGTLAFADHHRFTQRDLARIARAARGAEALFMTEKDEVRLEPAARKLLERVAPLAPIGLRTKLLEPERCLAQLLELLAVRHAPERLLWRENELAPVRT